MSKTDDSASENMNAEIAELNKALVKKENKIADLEQRLSRLEKRTKSNERFARTFESCLSTQIVAVDAVTDVIRRALREDNATHDELMDAIKYYDKHKFRRWFSGFTSVLLWVVSVMLAACVGAFIYWVFSGK